MPKNSTVGNQREQSWSLLVLPQGSLVRNMALHALSTEVLDREEREGKSEDWNMPDHRQGDK